MAYVYGLVLWYNIKDTGYCIILRYLANVEGKRLREYLSRRIKNVV